MNTNWFQSPDKNVNLELDPPSFHKYPPQISSPSALERICHSSGDLCNLQPACNLTCGPQYIIELKLYQEPTLLLNSLIKLIILYTFIVQTKNICLCHHSFRTVFTWGKKRERQLIFIDVNPTILYRSLSIKHYYDRYLPDD